MIRVISLISLLFLLTATGCRKKLVSFIDEKLVETPSEKKAEEEPDSESDPDPAPDPSVKSLFRIGNQLGVRVGVCEDGRCTRMALDVGGNSGVGFAEGIILNNGITLRENVLFISDELGKNLTGFIYDIFKTDKAIIGIPFVLDYPDEPIADLVFKVEVTGITPAMQIGVYEGPQGSNKARKSVQDLNGFTKGTISKSPGKAKGGVYYLMLHMSLEEVKDMYERIKSGTKVRFKITGTAEGYSEDVEVINVRLR